jgi:GNAT superfamily N-acetyltransferase
LRRYARCAASHSRTGEGWVAVATGARSNDMNGVVSDVGAPIGPEVVDDLLAWFADLGLPASWLVDGEGDDPGVAAMLVERGARPEAGGSWAGRYLDDSLLDLAGGSDVTIRRVSTSADLDDWLGVAARCGWIVDDRDRRSRRRLHLSLGLDDEDIAHWVARLGDRPVAMASAHVNGSVVDLCNLAVIDAQRRQGIGQALAGERIRIAHERGATLIVSALSPDGWKLYEPLGFASVPTHPGRHFHLPTLPF